MINNNEIKFELSTKNDIEVILNIIYQRCIWLKDNNVNQWNIDIYPNIYNRDYFLDVMNSEKLFVAKSNSGDVIGVVLLKNIDLEYWENEDNQAFYIHHLATKEEYKGLGKIIIDFCVKCALESGKKYLRLDCKDDNSKLNDYYEKLGFALKGNGHTEYYSYNLREKRLVN